MQQDGLRVDFWRDFPANRGSDQFATPTGRVSKSSKVDVKALKRKASAVKARRNASRDTKSLARLFGATIR